MFFYPRCCIALWSLFVEASDLLLVYHDVRHDVYHVLFLIVSDCNLRGNS